MLHDQNRRKLPPPVLPVGVGVSLV